MQTPERRCTSDRVVSLLEDIADSLRVLAHRERSESRSAKAVRLLVELGPDNITAIAKAVGVHRTTLYRIAPFRDALERMRAAAEWSRRHPRAIRPSGELADDEAA